MHSSQPRFINQTYDIIDHQLLGKGSTGNVYLGHSKGANPGLVAIKAIDMREIDNEVTRYLLSCQIAALSNLGKRQNTGHENIVKLIDIVIKDHFIYLVLELLQGGTLADYIKKNQNGLKQEQAFLIFKQIISGYRQIKNKQIIHRDLKPDNILFKSKNQLAKSIAIIDFGYCQMEEVPNKPQMYYNVGSPRYMSPQAFKQNFYSEKSDIWALGVILYEMLVGKTCDYGMSMNQYLDNLKKNGIPFPPHVNAFFKRLISCMLDLNPQSRYSCQTVIKQIEIYESRQQLSPQKSQLTFNRENMKEHHVVFQHQIRQNRVKNPIFHSVIVERSDHRIFEQQNSNHINNQLTKNQKWFAKNGMIEEQPNENSAYQKKMIKSNSTKVNLIDNGASYRKSMNEPILGKVQNVEYNSVRQIMQRKHQPEENNLMKNTQNIAFTQKIIANGQQRSVLRHFTEGYNIQRNNYKIINNRDFPIQNQQPILKMQSQVINSNTQPFSHVQHFQSPMGYMRSTLPTQQAYSSQVKLFDNNMQLPSSMNTELRRFQSNQGMKLLMKSVNLDREALKSSIEKHNYHSPEKNIQQKKVNFFTQKKVPLNHEANGISIKFVKNNLIQMEPQTPKNMAYFGQPIINNQIRRFDHLQQKLQIMNQFPQQSHGNYQKQVINHFNSLQDIKNNNHQNQFLGGGNVAVLRPGYIK